MTDQQKYSTIVGLSLLLAGTFFYLGYKVGGVQTVKSDTKIITNDVDHKVTTITEKPTGEKTTTITEDDHQSQTLNKDTTQVIVPKPKWNVSGLVALTSFKDLTPKYGVSITKEFLGMRIGAFGLTNGTAGVSLGIDF